MEQAVAKAYGALESVQGFSGHIVLNRCIVISVVHLLLDGGPPLAGYLQLADVTVALIIHFPRFAKDPPSFDISY